MTPLCVLPVLCGRQAPQILTKMPRNHSGYVLQKKFVKNEIIRGWHLAVDYQDKLTRAWKSTC
jgi:hypothetical protein